VHFPASALYRSPALSFKGPPCPCFLGKHVFILQESFPGTLAGPICHGAWGTAAALNGLASVLLQSCLALHPWFRGAANSNTLFPDTGEGSAPGLSIVILCLPSRRAWLMGPLVTVSKALPRRSATGLLQR